MQSQCDSGCVNLKKNEELHSLSLVDTVIPDQCANGLPQFEMKSCLFPAVTSEILRKLMFIFFGCFKTKKIVCILVISVCQIFSTVRNPYTPTLTFQNQLSRIQRTSICTKFTCFFSHFNFLQMTEIPLLLPWLACEFPC